MRGRTSTTRRRRSIGAAPLIGAITFGLPMVAGAAPAPSPQPSPPQPAPPQPAPPQPAPPQPAPAQPPPGYGAPPGQSPAPAYAQPGYGAPPAYGYPVMGPEYLPVREGEAPPPGYHHDTKIRKGLVIGGAVSFGTLYLISALSAALTLDVCSHCDGAAGLFVPGVGPFITAGIERVDSASVNVLLILDGLGQSAGIAMLVAGLAATEEVWVRNDFGSIEWTLAPDAASDRAGLQLLGRF